MTLDRGEVDDCIITDEGKGMTKFKMPNCEHCLHCPQFKTCIVRNVMVARSGRAVHKMPGRKEGK